MNPAMTSNDQLFPIFAKTDRRFVVGYINNSGDVLIEPQFASGGPISDGMGRVQARGKWGYVDPTGNFLVPPKYFAVGPPSEGMGSIATGYGKWGFVDRSARS